MPRVRPRNSWLPLADLSQTPSCMRWVFSGSRRASAMISPSTSSTTLRVLENGALNTAIPRSAASTRSTWLVPMQKHPTARRSLPASSTRDVILVLDRIPSSDTPGSRSTSSSSLSEPVVVSTSTPARRNASAATGWMFSSSRTFTGPKYCRRPEVFRPAGVRRAYRGWSAPVRAEFQVTQDVGVGGGPAEELAGPRRGQALVQREADARSGAGRRGERVADRADGAHREWSGEGECDARDRVHTEHLLQRETFGPLVGPDQPVDRQ